MSCSHDSNEEEHPCSDPDHINYSNIYETVMSGIACCGHISEDEIKLVREQFKSCIWAHWWEGSYGPEHFAVALVELQDGGYAVIQDSEDTSGHGRQCYGDLWFYRTLDEAVRLGLDTNARGLYLNALEG